MRFRIALTSKHVAGRFWLSSVQRARRVEGKKKIDRRIVVKPKSADKYVGQPNDNGLWSVDLTVPECFQVP